MLTEKSLPVLEHDERHIVGLFDDISLVKLFSRANLRSFSTVLIKDHQVIGVFLREIQLVQREVEGEAGTAGVVCHKVHHSFFLVGLQGEDRLFSFSSLLLLAIGWGVLEVGDGFNFVTAMLLGCLVATYSMVFDKTEEELNNG